MRIALIALHFAEYSYRLACALAAQHDVLFIVERGGFEAELGTWSESSRPPRLEICFIEHRRSLRAVFANAAEIRRSVDIFRPDVVHLQESIFDYLALAFVRLKRYPVVLTIHDPALHSGETRLAGMQKRFHTYRWLLRRFCNAAIAHGAFLCAEVERLLPHLKGSVFAIPHGPLGDMEATPSFDWEPGTLLFFGRIQAYKGLPYFIEAVERLAAEGRTVKGVIAGRGRDLDLYRGRLAASGLFEVNERFIPREEIPALFRRAQVVVLPYTDGTQSGVAALAMAFGRPVVASNVGSIPEMVRNDINGLLTMPRNVLSLSSSIGRLIADPDISRRLGIGGWQLARSELSWQRIAEATVDVYEKVVITKSRSSAC